MLVVKFDMGCESLRFAGGGRGPVGVLALRLCRLGLAVRLHLSCSTKKAILTETELLKPIGLLTVELG